jgi:hypothetical protein
MKHLFLFALFTLTLSTVSFAEEVDTDCAMMAESDSRIEGKDIKKPSQTKEEAPSSSVRQL